MLFFSFSFSQLCYLCACVLNNFPHRGYKLEARPPEDHSRRESHSRLAYTILCTFTPLLCFCFCLVWFGLALFCFVSHSRSVSVWFEISLTLPEYVSHNRTCRSLGGSRNMATDSLLPKAAEILKHQTQDQLNDNITSLMGQDSSQSRSTG